MRQFFDQRFFTVNRLIEGFDSKSFLSSKALRIKFFEWSKNKSLHLRICHQLIWLKDLRVNLWSNILRVNPVILCWLLLSVTEEGRYSCKWTGFLKNRIISLLEDKLSPDFYHGFFWSEENVVLNYFPTQDVVWILVCPLILIGHMVILINFMPDVKPIFC